MLKSFTAIIEQDEDGMYVGRVPHLRGCVTQGKSTDELVANLKDAVKLYLDVEGDNAFEISKFVAHNK